MRQHVLEECPGLREPPSSAKLRLYPRWRAAAIQEPMEHAPLPRRKRAALAPPVRHRARASAGRCLRARRSSHRKYTSVRMRSCSSVIGGVLPARQRIECGTVSIAAVHLGGCKRRRLMPGTLAQCLMAFRRVATAQRFLGSNRLGEHPVHFQSIHRCPACGRPPNEAASFPLKVIGPDLLAWVKNGGAPPRSRIGCRATRAFPEGAGNAGEGEVFERGRAAVGERVNVIGMKLRLLPSLGESAVFAAPARPLKHRAFQRDRHRHAAAAARSFSSESISASSTRPSASRRSAAVRGVP